MKNLNQSQRILGSKHNIEDYGDQEEKEEGDIAIKIP